MELFFLQEIILGEIKVTHFYWNGMEISVPSSSFVIL